jgi:hypothetical protein
MNVTIIAIVLGLLISAACIGIPQLVRIRSQRPDDDDTQAYLKKTGRSAQDVAQGNAAQLLRQQARATSQQAAGSPGPPPGQPPAPGSRPS